MSKLTEPMAVRWLTYVCEDKSRHRIAIRIWAPVVTPKKIFTKWSIDMLHEKGICVGGEDELDSLLRALKLLVSFIKNNIADGGRFEWGDGDDVADFDNGGLNIWGSDFS